MLAVKELLGEEKMNKALRQLITAHQDTFYLKATSLDFIEELYRVGSPEDSILIDDWFKRRITYDLKINKAHVKQQKDGRYAITVNIAAQRFEADEEGDVKKIDINEPLTIGLFSKHPKEMKKKDYQ